MALIACVVSTAAPLSAQQAADVSGFVVDQTGGALAGVTVTIRGPDTRQVRTDTMGGFVLTALPPGAYELSAAVAGFDTLRRAVTVEGVPLSLSLTLSVAFFTETVVAAARTGDADARMRW